jgi:hypothetical protein
MKSSIAFAVIIFILAACVPSPPMATVLPTTTPEWTAEPTVFFPATDAVPSPTPTFLPYYGHLQFPFLNADAGNFQLQTGEIIKFIWVEAPPNANYYEFVLYPLDGSVPIPLGTDNDSSDGVSLEWFVVPDVAAELRAFAYYGPDQPVLETFAPMIYSPSVSQ